MPLHLRAIRSRLHGPGAQPLAGDRELAPKRTRGPSARIAVDAARGDDLDAPHHEGKLARLLGSPRVRKAVVGVTIGATSLISVPLLAHHPGAPSNQPLRPDRPVATAQPFDHEGTLPSLSPAKPSSSSSTTTAPVATPPPPPAERAPLSPALSGFANVHDKELVRAAGGVQYLHFRADHASGPQLVHVVEVDLLRSDLAVRVSKVGERNQTVADFARSTDAIIAINGDWFSYANHMPHGLAMGDGEVWPGTADLAEWLFLACDGANRCTIDGEGSAAGIDPAWRNVVGGNGVPLVVDGQPRLNQESFYSSDREPRSAVGLTQDGRMFIVAIEGRLGDASGLTFNDTARLLADLGADRAMMLDGGGSTQLVMNGRLVSRVSEAERPVGDHLAIVPAG